MTSLSEHRHEGAEAYEVALRNRDQDRTLAAMHGLEAALGAAAPGREAEWRSDVLGALRALEDATATEEQNVARPDSLISEIARSHPRLRSRVNGVQAQYRKLRTSFAGIREDLELADESRIEADSLRHRLPWLLTALRYQRARESDLIYEAYYDTYQVDMEMDGDGLSDWTSRHGNAAGDGKRTL